MFHPGVRTVSMRTISFPRINTLLANSYTKRIERANLTISTRLKRFKRKTIGYSKSTEMHDKVIGTFIEREYYF